MSHTRIAQVALEILHYIAYNKKNGPGTGDTTHHTQEQSGTPWGQIVYGNNHSINQASEFLMSSTSAPNVAARLSLMRSAVVCLACLANTSFAFVGPLSAVRAPPTSNKASITTSTAPRPSRGSFVGVPALAAQQQQYGASLATGSGVGAVSMMGGDGKKTCIITGASSGERDS